MPRKKQDVKKVETKPAVSKRGRKPAPHLTAKSEPGFEKQAGFVVDVRFYNTFKDVCDKRNMTVSEVTRTLQEMWLKKQLGKDVAAC